MAVLRASIMLVASFPDGRNVGLDDFVGPLQAQASDDPVKVSYDRGQWASSTIEFFNRSLEDYRDEPEPSAAFFDEITTALTRVAEWIDERKGPLQDIRRSGLDVSLLVDMDIDQDQMELRLSPDVSRACGEAGISIEIITND
jgi:hypothetical protein